MTTASLAASDPGAAVGIDRLFLGLALAATAILVALVLLDHQPASAALIIGGFGLGVAFLKAEFSYTASWRRFLTRGEAGGILGGLIVIAVCAVVVVPVAALLPKYGGAIAPLGPSLVIGAFVFGIGMQLANGCGSGTLYTVGGGSGRMLVTLLFFVIGSVFGSLSLPAFLALGGIDPILASDYLGAWGGLIATLVSIAIAASLIIAFARRRGANFMPSRNYVIGGLAIGLLCVAVFLAGGHPWSVTFGYTVWGAKAATRARLRPFALGILAVAGPQACTCRIRIVRHLQSHGFRNDFRRHGGGRGVEAVRARQLAAREIIARRRDWRIADGVGRPPRFWLQYRRFCRGRRLRLAARMGLASRCVAGLPGRHPVAAAVRPVAGVAPCGSFTSLSCCSASEPS